MMFFVTILCDLCVKPGLTESAMVPQPKIDGEGKRISDVYCCRIHHTREYHPYTGCFHS
jgi:hypothetical protein